MYCQELNEASSESNDIHPDLFNEPSSLELPLIPANSKDDVEVQINILLDTQMNLARHFCLESKFMNVLRKRLIVLHRIFHAYMVKFNIRDKTWNRVSFTQIRAKKINPRLHN